VTELISKVLQFSDGTDLKSAPI